MVVGTGAVLTWITGVTLTLGAPDQLLLILMLGVSMAGLVSVMAARKLAGEQASWQPD